MEFPIGTRVEMKRVVATYVHVDGSQVVSANDIHGVSLSYLWHAHHSVARPPARMRRKTGWFTRLYSVYRRYDKLALYSASLGMPPCPYAIMQQSATI